MSKPYQDKSSPLEVVTAQDPRFQNQVELAVRFGKTLFISEVDTVRRCTFRCAVMASGARCGASVC